MKDIRQYGLLQTNLDNLYETFEKAFHTTKYAAKGSKSEGNFTSCLKSTIETLKSKAIVALMQPSGRINHASMFMALSRFKKKLRKIKNS